MKRQREQEKKERADRKRAKRDLKKEPVKPMDLPEEQFSTGQEPQ